jgi:hypothetical protein
MASAHSLRFVTHAQARNKKNMMLHPPPAIVMMASITLCVDQEA